MPPEFNSLISTRRRAGLLMCAAVFAAQATAYAAPDEDVLGKAAG